MLPSHEPLIPLTRPVAYRGTPFADARACGQAPARPRPPDGA